MAISEKTRKTLWGRSGNRCAMCRVELVAEKNGHNKHLNIGDECHIISARPSGPRHQPSLAIDFDSYDNLILLCKNHHRTIDELWETYTVSLLQTIKANHEKWIQDVINQANKEGSGRLTKFLPRLVTGKQLVDILFEVHAFQFDYDPFQTQEEMEVIAGFLQDLQDWGELSGMTVFEVGYRVEKGYEWNTNIKKVEDLGFYLFGERQQRRLKPEKEGQPLIWEVAVILVLRKDNPGIIDLGQQTKVES